MNIDVQEIWLDEVDSTNRYALQNFDSIASNSLIIADSQTGGRGRRGRRWISPPGENIYASLVLKDFPFPPYKGSWIGSIAALETLKQIAPELNLWLKWPNDIYCRSKKISGILCEVKSDTSNKILGIVIGIGMNLNMKKSTLDAIDQPATSLFAEQNKKINIKKVANTLCKHLMLTYHNALKYGVDELFQTWKKLNYLIDKEVEIVTDDNRILTGTMVDIAPSGELILETNDERISFHSGDVNIKKAKGLFNKQV